MWAKAYKRKETNLFSTSIQATRRLNTQQHNTGNETQKLHP